MKRRLLTISGGGWVTFDWAPGVGVAIAGSLFSFWRSTGIAQTRGEERLATMRNELARVEKQGKELAEMVHEGLQRTFLKVNDMFTEMKVQAAEQAAFNRICTKTLESLVAKNETLGSMLQTHETAILILKNDMEKKKA